MVVVNGQQDQSEASPNKSETSTVKSPDMDKKSTESPTKGVLVSIKSPETDKKPTESPIKSESNVKSPAVDIKSVPPTKNNPSSAASPVKSKSPGPLVNAEPKDSPKNSLQSVDNKSETEGKTPDLKNERKVNSILMNDETESPKIQTIDSRTATETDSRPKQKESLQKSDTTSESKDRKDDSRNDDSFSSLLEDPDFKDITYMDVNLNRTLKRSRSPEVLRREYLLKVVMLGEVGVGKTSIVSRFNNDKFTNDYRATIGVDFSSKTFDWNGDVKVGLSIWDIAGSERMGNMTRILYREALGALVAFDVTRPSTLNAAMKWKEDLDSKVVLPDGTPVACVLVANKCDLVKQGIVKEAQKMNKFCDDNGFLSWFETSAKEGTGIEDAFSFLTNRMLTVKLRSQQAVSTEGRITLKTEEKKESACFC